MLKMSYLAASTGLINYVTGQSEDPELTQLMNNSSLQMTKIDFPCANISLYADISTSTIHPYLPPKHRLLSCATCTNSPIQVRELSRS